MATKTMSPAMRRKALAEKEAEAATPKKTTTRKKAAAKPAANSPAERRRKRAETPVDETPAKAKKKPATTRRPKKAVTADKKASTVKTRAKRTTVVRRDDGTKAYIDNIETDRIQHQLNVCGKCEMYVAYAEVNGKFVLVEVAQTDSTTDDAGNETIDIAAYPGFVHTDYCGKRSDITDPPEAVETS